MKLSLYMPTSWREKGNKLFVFRGIRENGGGKIRQNTGLQMCTFLQTAGECGEMDDNM
jgi:hypothetical protein